jgi:hypothetical protein
VSVHPHDEYEDGLSNCCNAPILSGGICSDCREHCEPEEEDCVTDDERSYGPYYKNMPRDESARACIDALFDSSPFTAKWDDPWATSASPWSGSPEDIRPDEDVRPDSMITAEPYDDDLFINFERDDTPSALRIRRILSRTTQAGPKARLDREMLFNREVKRNPAFKRHWNEYVQRSKL